MRFNRKYTVITGLFWMLGITSLLLAGCDASGDAAKTATPKTGAAPITTKAADVSKESTAFPSAGGVHQNLPEVVMYKSPNCECCTGWAKHLRQQGFTVVVHKREDMDAIKKRFGVPEKLASCHTATVDGYIIEGHVPAEDVARLIKERPQITGLTAPGMPMKSPGMQPDGNKPQGYDVLAFDKDGKASVFHRY